MRSTWLRSAVLMLAIACGGAEEAEETQAVEIGGRYEVTGVTIGLTDGTQRPIQGTINVVVEGGQYTAHFELSTRFPGSEALAASVVGAGGGEVDGSVLIGTAKTNLVMASVPGVDLGFAYIPREVGPRILSRSRAEFFPDGSVQAEIENEPVEGEDYAPTRTSLVGYRVDG
jgi:hypothetical protein